MKKMLLATAALLAMGATSNAADLAARTYTKAPPAVVAPAVNWSGFYVGAMGGYGWTQTVSIDSQNFSDELNGGFGGGTIGYNWQMGSPWVFGIEVDAAGASIKKSELGAEAIEAVDGSFEQIEAAIQGQRKVVGRELGVEVPDKASIGPLQDFQHEANGWLDKGACPDIHSDRDGGKVPFVGISRIAEYIDPGGNGQFIAHSDSWATLAL